MESRIRQLDRFGIKRFERLVKKSGRILFPHFCLSCGKEGKLLCRTCEVNISTPQRGVLFCVNCGKEGIVCGCGSHTVRGLAVDRYANPIFRGLLHAYKYGGVKEAGEILGRMFVSGLARQAGVVLADLADPVVVSVPMHPINKAMRGFNQVEQLARLFAQDFELESNFGAIGRRVAWRAQAKINQPAKRMKNTDNAFCLANDNLRGRDILLVDDVFTTGATVRACLSVIKDTVGSVQVITCLKG